MANRPITPEELAALKLDLGQRERVLVRQQQELYQQLLYYQRELHRQSLLCQQEIDQHLFRVQTQLTQLQPRAEQTQHLNLLGPRSSEGKRSKPTLRNAQGQPMDPWQWEDKPTTIMVRRLPRHYTQRQLLELLESLGFGGLFDFVYLPWDIMHDVNAGGFGFVNFREPEYALMFRYACRRHQVEGKTIQVQPAQLQGFEANYKHFAASKIGHHESLRPIFIPQASAHD